MQREKKTNKQENMRLTIGKREEQKIAKLFIQNEKKKKENSCAQRKKTSSFIDISPNHSFRYC